MPVTNITSAQLTNTTDNEQLPKEFGKKEIYNSALITGYDHTKRKDFLTNKQRYELKKRQALKDQNSDLDNNTTEDDYENDSDNDVDDFILEDLPITNEASLHQHEKCISAIAIDRSGARLVTGDYISQVHLWDFSGMNYEKLKPFRTYEPFIGYQIRDIKYNLNSSLVLIVSSSQNPKIYDRDGFDLAEFAKGDPYLHDLKKTKGHIAGIVNCDWHPKNPDLFLTGGHDSTIRQWNIYENSQNYSVIFARTGSRMNRTWVTTTGYSPDGKLIFGGMKDGAISLWDQKGPYVRPNLSVKGHKENTNISSIIFSANLNHLVSRGGDNTVKLWDVRNFTQPVLFRENLPVFYTETNLAFSPDEKLIACGTCERSDDVKNGKLILLERDSLQSIEEIDVSNSGVNKIMWHHGLNQIFCGTGEGEIKIYFNPKTSVKGIKLCVNKHQIRKPKSETETSGYNPMIIAPFAYPDYQDEPITISVSERKKMRMDPVKSRRPDPPVVGPGRNGQIGTSFANNLIKQKFKGRDIVREDPREALYKYDKVAKESPYFVTPAYKKYQPNPIFKDAQDEDDELREVVKRQVRPPKED